MRKVTGLLMILAVTSLVALLPRTVAQQERYRAVDADDVVDLSVPVAENLPCWWPGGHPQFQRIPYRQIGPGPSATDWLIIDEHTGTQWDAPAHFLPPPHSGLPNAHPMGRLTSDKVPIYQFVGEACVIDVTNLLDKAEPGASPLITVEMVKAWEQKNRPLGFGDVVLFHSGYTDKYYKPLPDGRRLVADPLEKKAPAWAAPHPDVMDYLGSKGVMTLGIDSPSMGPIPDLAAATHIAGSRHGAIWAEMLTNLGKLPTTGAFFAMLAPKHADGSGSECRAIAVTNRQLAARLIAAAKQKKVVDLTVLLREDLPVTFPGAGVGNYAAPYVSKVYNWFTDYRGAYYARLHLMDMHCGTHLDPPSHFLPPPGFDNDRYDAFTRDVLKDYERRYGKRGNSTVTTEQVPVEQMMGPARVIDVTHLVGTVDPKNFPDSPDITVDDIRQHEKIYGELQKGEIVLFRSGHSDRTFAPFPEGSRCTADPLNGKAEGWPAPTPETLRYLAKRGIRCVGTDGPSMGAANRRKSIMTHWAGLGEGMVFIEFLTGLGQLPPKGAFFIFAPVKIVGGHGGNGRAIAILP